MQPSTGYEHDPDNSTRLYRGQTKPIAQVRSIDASTRLLQPTQASQARSISKVQTASARERSQRQEAEKRRRKLFRSAKNKTGKLTVAQAPKFQQRRATTRHVDRLTRTSRELLEIAELKKHVESTRRKYQRYHALTSGQASSQSSKDDADVEIEAGTREQTKVESAPFGVPHVPKKKTTVCKDFQFRTNSRAQSETRKSLVRVMEENAKRREEMLAMKRKKTPVWGPPPKDKAQLHKIRS